MVLIRFQYKPVSLDRNKVCFEEGQDIPNTREKSRKNQSVTEWCRCGKLGVMHRCRCDKLGVMHRCRCDKLGVVHRCRCDKLGVMHRCRCRKLGVMHRCRYHELGVMHTNVEYLSCGKVETLGYFQLSDMRYDDRNVVRKS